MRRSDFQRSAGGSAGERPRWRHVFRLALRLAGTRILPTVLLFAVAGFYVAIAVEHANPPVIAVQGSSMRPVLSNGDLVLLQGVPPTALRKGDVIAVAVPVGVQARDHLPPDIEHRIVAVTRTPQGIRFTVKGDADPRPDPFEILPSEILGKVTGSIPLLGYAFLFFGSVPGDIALALLAVAAAGYLLVRWWTRRRACRRRLAGAIMALREDADQIRTALTGASEFPAPSAAAAGPAQEAASGKLDHATSVLDELVTEVRATSDQTRDSAEMLRELVEAVSEYGVHLRSHTAVMRNLAATTVQLQEAAGRLANALTSPAPPLRPLAPEQRFDVRGQRPAAEPWHEPFTALELRWPNLARTAGGYVAEPVERLLDRAADALELAERERDSLRERLLVVETRLAVLNEQQGSVVQARLAAQREAQELDARARHEATLALEEASRRAADIARDVAEERRRLLEIARELGRQLRAAGARLGGEVVPSPTPPAGPQVSQAPFEAAATPPGVAAAPPPEAIHPPAAISPPAPLPSRAAATPSAISEPASPAPSSGSEARRREPPDIPPVWEVTPPPTR